MKEFALSILSSAAVSTFLSAFLIWLTKSWIAERLKSSIKSEYDAKLETHKAQLKAQTDTEVERLKAQLKASSDTEIERLKAQLNIASAEHQIRFAGLHNKRAEVIADIYASLVQAHWDGASFASPAEFAGEPSKREKYVTAIKSLTEFYRVFERNRIYLPEAVCQLVDPLIVSMRSSVITYGTYLDYDTPGVLDETLREKHRVWMESWKFFEEDVPPARRALEQELRRLLGDSSPH